MNAVEVLLQRHDARRASGLPTVTVMVGPVGAGIAAIQAWASRRGSVWRIGSVADLAGLASLYFEAVQSQRDLWADVCAALAVGRSPNELRTELSAMSRHDLDQFVSANAGRWSGPGASLAVRYAEAVVAGQTIDCAWALGGGTAMELLSGLNAIVLPGAMPGVLVTPSLTTPLTEWLLATAVLTSTVAQEVPSLPIGIAIPASDWSRFVNEAPENRVKAIMREGVITLPVLGQEEVTRMLRQSGVDPIPAAIEAVIADGATIDLAESIVRAATTPMDGATEEQDSAARSAAEAFLFQFLESLPATAGRFQLNADPGFRFGARAAEIDLLASEPRIAIEIDGYYHFRDHENYRRDRNKDWELQQRGFLVLRFLADDIIRRLEEVRDRILDALKLRTT